MCNFINTRTDTVTDTERERERHTHTERHRERERHTHTRMIKVTGPDGTVMCNLYMAVFVPERLLKKYLHSISVGFSPTLYC